MMIEKFYCVDPSCFLSYDSISDLLKVLQDLKGGNYYEPRSGFRGSRILIPADLADGLYNLLREQVDPYLLDIFQTWLPFYTEEEVREILEGLANDSGYKGLLQEFLRYMEEWNRAESSKYMEELQKELNKLQIDTPGLKEKILELRKVSGRVISKMLAFSAFKKAKIISFADTIAYILKDLGVTIREGFSRVKDAIKKRTNIVRGLKISAFCFGTDEAKEFLRHMQAHVSIEGIAATIIATVGLYLIADGF